jgi:hypothetical protein
VGNRWQQDSDGGSATISGISEALERREAGTWVYYTFSSRSTARAPQMQSERNIGQVDAKRSYARARTTQKASDDRFGGELTSQCYKDGGAFAPIPAA